MRKADDTYELSIGNKLLKGKLKLKIKHKSEVLCRQDSESVSTNDLGWKRSEREWVESNFGKSSY